MIDSSPLFFYAFSFSLFNSFTKYFFLSFCYYSVLFFALYSPFPVLSLHCTHPLSYLQFTHPQVSSVEESAALCETYFALVQTLLNRVDQAVLSFAPQGGSPVPQGGPNQTPDSHPSGKFSSQLYGTLHLLLCLLRNKKVKTEIDPYFSRTFAESLVRTLLNLIKSYEECSAQNVLSDSDVTAFWPQWISPLCVLLYELVTASLSLTEIVMSSVKTTETKSVNSEMEKKDDSEEKTETLIAEEKESEVSESSNDVQEEKKEGKEEGKEEEKEKEEEKDLEKEEVDEAVLSLELGGILRDEVEKSSLLSEGSWVIIFETISRILHTSSIHTNTTRSHPVSGDTEDTLDTLTNTPGKDLNPDNGTFLGPKKTPARYLDPSSSQGVLLLLHTLISKQNLSEKFVLSGGLY